MKVKLKCGDKFVEVDSELSVDEVNTLEKMKKNNVDIEDTLEFDFNSEVDFDNGTVEKTKN